MITAKFSLFYIYHCLSNFFNLLSVENNEVVENDEEEIKEQISNEVEIMNEKIEKERADLQDKSNLLFYC